MFVDGVCASRGSGAECEKRLLTRQLLAKFSPLSARFPHIFTQIWPRTHKKTGFENESAGHYPNERWVFCDLWLANQHVPSRICCQVSKIHFSGMLLFECVPADLFRGSRQSLTPFTACGGECGCETLFTCLQMKFFCKFRELKKSECV